MWSANNITTIDILAAMLKFRVWLAKLLEIILKYCLRRWPIVKVDQNALESSDSNVEVPLKDNLPSLESEKDIEEVSSEEEIKETKKRPSKGLRNTKTKKLKPNTVKEKKLSKWPDLNATVFQTMEITLPWTS